MDARAQALLRQRVLSQRSREQASTADLPAPPALRCARCGLALQSELEPWIGEFYECKDKQECHARGHYGANEFARDVALGTKTLADAPPGPGDYGQFLVRAGRFWDTGRAPLRDQ